MAVHKVVLVSVHHHTFGNIILKTVHKGRCISVKAALLSGAGNGKDYCCCQNRCRFHCHILYIRVNRIAWRELQFQSHFVPPGLVWQECGLSGAGIAYSNVIDRITENPMHPVLSN